MHLDNRNALVAVLLLASKDPTSINEAFEKWQNLIFDYTLTY